MGQLKYIVMARNGLQNENVSIDKTNISQSNFYEKEITAAYPIVHRKKHPRPVRIHHQGR